jgi:hypothetical protein
LRPHYRLHPTIKSHLFDSHHSFLARSSLLSDRHFFLTLLIASFIIESLAYLILLLLLNPCLLNLPTCRKAFPATATILGRGAWSAWSVWWRDQADQIN